jgi:hypothetical protein
LSVGAASSCSPRSRIWSLIFCGRGASLSACAAGEAVAEGVAAVFAPVLFAFMSDEHAAASSDRAETAQKRDARRKSFIQSSGVWNLARSITLREVKP